MLLDDDLVVRTGLFEGNKLTPATHHDRPLALCRFGLSQAQSLVAISQTLDELLVYDLTLFGRRLLSVHNVEGNHEATSEHYLNKPQYVSHISIKDQVINTIEVVTGATTLPLTTTTHRHEPPPKNRRDLLLIGCTNSIMVYDTLELAHLFSVSTSARVNSISTAQLLQTRVLFCGGIQKLYTYQMDYMQQQQQQQIQIQAMDAASSPVTINSRPFWVLELSSERTTSESISCLIYGSFNQCNCLVTGSQEAKIRVYSVDPFDQTIQACKLTLNESAKVNCLCPIETLQASDTASGIGKSSSPKRESQAEFVVHDRPQQQTSLLPSIEQQTNIPDPTSSSRGQQLQMNYFAYGLENGSIGVYRLLATTPASIIRPTDAMYEDNQFNSSNGQRQQYQQHQQLQVGLFGERLWRHKSRREAPLSMLMFDIDGDGLDELIVGYRNSRLEVRSPFTGQLLATTRCFRAGQLVGFARWSLESSPSPAVSSPMDEHAADGAQNAGPQNFKPMARRQILVASSTSSALVAFRPQQRRPHEPLKDYLASSVASGAGGGDGVGDLSRIDSADHWTGSGNQVGSQVADESPDRGARGGQLELAIETAGDNPRPLGCESRQNADLLQRISSLKNEQVQLEDRFRRLYQDLIQRQLASRTSQGYAGADDHLTLAHSWDIDQSNRLRLTILVSGAGQPLAEGGRSSNMVDMVEFVDESRLLLRDGRLVVSGPMRTTHRVVTRDDHTSHQQSPPVAVVSLALNMPHYDVSGSDGTSRGYHQIELLLRVFCSSVPGASQRPSIARDVHEQLLVLPKFGMLVPESLISSTGTTKSTKATIMSEDNDGEKKKMIRMVFRADESEHRPQILNWMYDNFLCFHFGHFARGDHHHQQRSGNHYDQHEDDCGLWLPPQPTGSTHDKGPHQQAWWSSSSSSSSSSSPPPPQPPLPLPLPELNVDPLMVSATKRLRHELQGHGFEFKFVDLRGSVMDSGERGAGRVVSHNRLGLAFDAKRQQLTIDSDDSDLLVDVIQSLVIDRLQLDMRSHSLPTHAQHYHAQHGGDGMQSYQTGGVEVILDELGSISESSKQLEESERHIQTEIYESAHLIKSLMEQFAIANELNEFATSKELLSEVSMMLNGTQNSAQAFYLNNKSRLELMKRTNCLREKVLFLTGEGGLGEQQQTT